MIQLTRRERRLGIGMAAVIVVWSAYGFVIQPMRDRIQTLQRTIPTKQAELQDIQAKSRRYLRLREEVEDARARMAGQDAEFQLLPFLESLIERHNLTPYLVTMEPGASLSQPGYSEAIVDIGLEGIRLGQLVEFLDLVETSGALLHIGSLTVRKGAVNEALLTATVQISNPQLTENTVAVDHTGP